MTNRTEGMDRRTLLQTLAFMPAATLAATSANLELLALRHEFQRTLRVHSVRVEAAEAAHARFVERIVAMNGGRLPDYLELTRLYLNDALTKETGYQAASDAQHVTLNKLQRINDRYKLLSGGDTLI